jgi:hypothetical protein
MKEYDNNISTEYEKNLKEMHNVLTDRCSRYMTKCNELENVIKNQDAMKELKASNLVFMFEKWKLRSKLLKIMRTVKGETPFESIEIIKLCREIIKPKKGDISIMHENTYRSKKNDEKLEAIKLENQKIRIHANSYINKFNYSQVIIQ